MHTCCNCGLQQQNRRFAKECQSQMSPHTLVSPIKVTLPDSSNELLVQHQVNTPDAKERNIVQDERTSRC